MEVAEAVAAFVAWTGASVIVLADGRRGLALGLALTTAGVAVLAGLAAGAAAGLVLGAGGAAAAAMRYRTGTPGWAVMPASSTPRLVLCIASGLVALWVAASVTTGAGAATRFVVLALLALAGGRVISARDSAAIASAVTVLALALGVGAALASQAPGLAPNVAAALVAAGVTFIRTPAPHVA